MADITVKGEIMVRRVPVLAAAFAVVGALVLTGCQTNSHTCRNGECHVTATGTGQTLDINDHDVRVMSISGGSLTVSVDGSPPARIAVGNSARVGAAQIRVTSIEDETVKFDLRS